MSTLDYINRVILPAVFALLPTRMDTMDARAIMLTIGLQESRFNHRMQVGGPARGFWQFEQGGGVKGVLQHAASRPILLPILDTLGYEADANECYGAIVHNDVLAAAFARLLLWTHPKPLPAPDDAQGAWNYYIATWRPGRPHRETWNAFHEQAWGVV